MTNVGRVEALAAIATGLLLLCGHSVSADGPDFLTELNRARRVVAEEAPAKAFYEGPFNKAFYAHYSGWLNQCTQRTGQGLLDFDMLVTLSHLGEVQALRVEPEGGLTRCFAELVRKERFPEPPSHGLTLPVSVRISKP